MVKPELPLATIVMHSMTYPSEEKPAARAAGLVSIKNRLD